MNERGQYGRQGMQRWAGGAPADPDQPTTWTLPQIDYQTTGAALGFGVLFGIIIGSKLTFHTPVRRRH
jgi:hypothetical protein